MHLYLEFDAIVRRFAEEHVRYAVAGALAVALHGFLRNTEDIDILVGHEDLERASGILKAMGYQSSSAPWTFKDTQITLWRFIKPDRNSEELMVVDVMVPESPEGQAILDRSVTVAYADLTLRVVGRDDLIAMKRARNSALDKADIEKIKGNGTDEAV
ncbi:MAG: nucleotidyltransferase family protein [Kiritimatiellae bacterium]|nr:nucleotidyltransferase family protein [Kiritimatiellia bacterium]